MVVGAAFLAASCADTAEPMGPASPETTQPTAASGDGRLAIPVTTSQTLDIPLRPPQGIEGITALVPPEAPCTVEATARNDALGFERDSFVVSPEGAGRIRQFVDEILINQHPLREIELSGYASSEGDDAYNLTLSQRRADAVARLLGTIPRIQNVPTHPVGKGEADPKGDNRTAEGRVANRRVELAFRFSGCA